MDAKTRQQEHFKDFPSTPKATQEYYDQYWGPGKKYDQDMLDWNYTTPKEGAELLAEFVEDRSAPILDAGCGTGLVGTALKELGYTNIIGADFSQSMLDGCPKDTYKDLKFCDLNDDLPFDARSFSAVISIGTFTFGHVKSDALDEFVRITKPGGLICFTINEGIYKDYGFDKKILDLKANNKWDEVEFFKSDYIASKDVNAWLGLYKVK
mgnify:CR=1 FL=1